MHLIFFEYDEAEDEYTPMQSGFNIVPTSVVDKVLPVSKNVSRQFDKVYYKDGKLKVREGHELLSDKELDEIDSQSIGDVGNPFKASKGSIVEISD